MENLNQIWRQELLRLLMTHFSRAELHTLCFAIGINDDDLPGETRTEQARELINLLTRQKRVPELLELVRRERPSVQWPTIPNDLTIEAPSTSAPETRPPSAPTFNISGPIQAANVNLGGSQTVTGSIQADMRQTHVHQSGGTVSIGDTFTLSGNFQDTIVQVKSNLNRAYQTIQNIGQGDKVQKEALLQEIAGLQNELTKVSPEYIEDAAKVSRSLIHLAEEMKEEKPDREMIRITGESLKKAAENLKGSMPAVLFIATQIVNRALQFIS
jgi:hypothetical protein